MAAITATPGTVTDTDIEAALPMVRALVATRFRIGHHGNVDLDDLVQAGMEGVCEAAKRWTPGKASFHGYAYCRALGAIRDHLRAQQAGTRRHPHDEPLSLSHPHTTDPDDPRTVADTLSTEDRYDGLIWADFERDLGKRDARILRLYAGGFLLRDIAQGEGVSEGRISQLITGARPTVREWADMKAA